MNKILEQTSNYYKQNYLKSQKILNVNNKNDWIIDRNINNNNIIEKNFKEYFIQEEMNRINNAFVLIKIINQ